MKRAERQHRLDPGLRGWLVNYSKRNFWRVPSCYDLDDLIQDGYLCYCVCNAKYRHVKVQRHFMALVKVTFHNHITDLANERTRLGEVLVPPDSPTLDRVETPDALCAVLLRQLPDELKQLLHVLLHGARQIPMRRYADGTRETTNDYLCRLLGVDPDLVDVENVFREHFAT